MLVCDYDADSRAAVYAATRTIKSAPENSAGTRNMNRQAITPLANVATAVIAIIGRAFVAFVRARDAICHNSAVCNSIVRLIQCRDRADPYVLKA